MNTEHAACQQTHCTTPKHTPAPKHFLPANLSQTAKRFVCDHAVLCVAFAAATASAVVVPPDARYLSYFDLKTLACLFGILAIAAALRNAGALDAAARAIATRFTQCRSASAALTGITLVLSQFVTNDMALVVMLPLSATVLARAGWHKAIPFTFIMQNLAANLGGMILPFGNPQNLFLYEHFRIPFDQFVGTMALSFLASCALIVICYVAHVFPAMQQSQSTAQAAKTPDNQPKIDRLRTTAGLALFALAIAAVFRIIPWPLMLAVVCVVLACTCRAALKSIDVALLLTFACFFVFSGNMARIPALDALLEYGMQTNPLALSAGASQVISNVPAAILLSAATDTWQQLLVGVNIGGAGTPIASLASLITISHYQAAKGNSENALPSTARFIALLTLYGFAFLALLMLVCSARFALC